MTADLVPYVDRLFASLVNAPLFSFATGCRLTQSPWRREVWNRFGFATFGWQMSRSSDHLQARYIETIAATCKRRGCRQSFGIRRSWEGTLGRRSNRRRRLKAFLLHLWSTKPC